MKNTAYNILWGLDEGEEVDLPTEIEIPDEIAKEGDLDKVSDYLSDLTGFCHNGFRIRDDKGC